MIKYKTLFDDKIEKVDVVRETDSSVWRLDRRGKERRHSKKSSYEIYFDTWHEAHDYLVEKAKGSVGAAKSRLTWAEEKLAKIEAMKDTSHDH